MSAVPDAVVAAPVGKSAAPDAGAERPEADCSPADPREPAAEIVQVGRTLEALLRTSREEPVR
ncbi:hypothetical protein [Amycolatopsis sp. NBC_00438]|uniref:hypothetical protein n=1 Tax=Amycolatopsis sp. NBC_00438 TaxID=2903558 RepID=UPI002E22B3B4